MSEVTGRHTLVHPLSVTFKGPDGEREETITEVIVRRPKGKDLRVADQYPGEVAQSLALMARLTGLDPKQVDELDAEDIAAIGAIIESFTPPGLRTGKTSSGA